MLMRAGGVAILQASLFGTVLQHLNSFVYHAAVADCSQDCYVFGKD